MYLQQFEVYWSNRCVIDSYEEGIEDGQVLGLTVDDLKNTCKLTLQKAKIGIDFVENGYFAVDLQHVKLAVLFTEKIINDMKVS